MLFTKEGCHLCDEVEATIKSMDLGGTGLTVVDVETDPTVHDKYWLRVPVVAVDGKDIFEAKMMDPEGKWRRTLASALET